jgi:putative ABC transport system permease protein
MMLALRDAAFARGRFALVGGVIALLTLLVSLLSGLTAGLGAQSTSALEAAGKAGVSRIQTSTTDMGLSSITPAQIKDAQSAVGADHAVAVTIRMARLESAAGEKPVQAAVFAAGRPTPWVAAVPERGLALPADMATALKVSVGDSVKVNGVAQTVSSVTAPEVSYAHAAVVGMPASQAAAVLHADAPNAILTDSTTLAVDGLTTHTVKDSFNLIPGYKSEHGSLLLIQVILYVIAGLVVAAFLTIWTLQRTRDLALLRALGASEGFLFRDGLAQAGIVLLGGTLVGGLAGWGLGALAAQAVPFQLSLTTLGLPAALILAVGFVGSLGAVSRVRTINPLSALAGN